MKNRKKVCVVGLGYVGLPLAILAAEKGYEVIGVDIDEAKVDMIRNKISPIKDDEISKKLLDVEIEVSTSFNAAIDASVIIICVPTPVYENHMPNLELVKSATKKVAKILQPGQLVVLESTVNPGVSETIVTPILENESKLRCGKDFYLAHCPERINPGDPKWNVENINRVVGATSSEGLKKSVEFYESIIDAEIKPMKSIKEAEAVKVVENSFRDINIAFVNELAMSFSKLGIDVVNVIEGAATKPFSFMPHFPGCGVGGHCIPVDPYYLIDYAKKNGFDHDFLALARRINSRMPEFTAQQVVVALNEIKKSINGAKIAVLGLAYKPGIDDCRESPSFEIIKALEKHGAEVVTHDPYVEKLSTAKTIDDAFDGAECVVIATGHGEFIELPLEYYLKNGIKVIVDGRNCLDENMFLDTEIIYKGIGK
jgi:nucleotide sugar dehydrogenase